VALTSRGKALVAGGSVVAVLGGGMAALALSGNAPASVTNLVDQALPGDQTPATPCPLTGETLPGDKEPPDRPVLAVKVENAPEARPQSGLDEADIVYEEPVEGGVTRFIAMFHCHDAKRLGPVRSARTTDVSVLAPLDTPLFGFAGGSNLVKKAVAESDVVDLNYIDAAERYVRDESREAPHNLYTSTKALFKSAKKGGAAEPIFSYGDIADGSRPVGGVHLLFSEAYADVNWTWDRGNSTWLRSHGTEPHMLENGRQVSTESIVVLHVKVRDSKVLEDVAGYPSPEVTLKGSGKAWLFRDGRMVLGRWTRDGDEDYVRLQTKDGSEMNLVPGTAWVELLPNTVPVEIAKR
jgi:hypothetical protein